MGSLTETVSLSENQTNGVVPEKSPRKPLQLTGALDRFESFDVTPVIGREFPSATLKEWLEDPNSDDLLRDLAVTGVISRFSLTVLI